MKIFKNKKGFTLVELLVAVSLFIVITTISIGAILSIFDANKKAQSSKTVVDNLNFSIENMARTVRFGSRYHCGGGNLTIPQNCPLGDDYVAVTFKGAVVVYKWDGPGDPIERSDNGGVSFSDITSPETVVEYVRFYVFNAFDSDDTQPYVVAVIKGYVGDRPTRQSVFSIQTMMSQRALDI